MVIKKEERKVIIMNAYETFILMFYALDAIYDENPNEALGDYLSGLNPFLFQGEGSADPAEFEEFNSEYKKKYAKSTISSEEAYNFCKAYLTTHANGKIVDAFLQITLETWKAACDHNS